MARQTFYRLRIHLRLCWPGLITRFSIAPANAHDLALVPELTAGSQGIVLRARNYWSPALTQELADRGATLRPLRVEAKKPLAPAELPDQPTTLPRRSSIRSTGGTVPNLTDSSQRQLALALSAAAQDPQPYHVHSHQLTDSFIVDLPPLHRTGMSLSRAPTGCPARGFRLILDLPATISTKATNPGSEPVYHAFFVNFIEMRL